MDTHILPLIQDPLAMERINVRVRTAEPDMTAMFHRFDGARFRWLAQQLRDAGSESIAALADDWALEHELVAVKLEEAA